VDNENFSVILHDYYKYYFKVNTSKNDFFKASIINVFDCKDVFEPKNIYKYKTKHYAFFNAKDTLINGESLKKYEYRYLKSKKIKIKKRIGRATHIIKKNTNFHLPILRFSTAFYDWEKEKSIPNGIFQEYIFHNYEEKITTHCKLLEIKRLFKNHVNLP
jgi:hypothetical protein